MPGFRINQTINEDGTYTLNEEIVYHSPRYGKTITVPAGYPSDGATGAFDTVSRYWWVHDLLCDRGTFDDGTKLTNWQCSQVLQDVLVEESKMFKGRERFYVWCASKYRFWATWFGGGGECRKNGMLVLFILLSINISGCVGLGGRISSVTDPSGKVYKIRCQSDGLVEFTQGDVKIKVDNRGPLGQVWAAGTASLGKIYDKLKEKEVTDGPLVK